jgi:DNA end-binding protein Ku
MGENKEMPRPIWSGSISFGLVNVPIKLLTAQSPKDIRFNQLHAADNARISQKRVCSLDGEEVPFEQIVKGYEISPGSYVVVDTDELESIIPDATHSIDIEEFVDLDEIDPIYYERAYYLVPDRRAEKPYRLLAEAMGRTNKVAIARFVMRTKQYLASVRAVDGVLVLSTMLFADEVVPVKGLEGVPGEEVDISDRELSMAEQLIASLGADFEPEKYHDTYREQLVDIITRKAEGQEVAAPTAAPSPAAVVDLMAALEASLAASKTGKDQADSATPKAPRAKRERAAKAG